MKKVLFILIPIILIAIIVITISTIANNNLKYEIEEVSEYNYFKLYQNQKYGVIDKEGKIIIEAIYDNLYIPNPSKAVFVCYYDYNEQEEYKIKVFNENKEELFTNYDKVDAFIFKDSNLSKIPFEKSVLKYEKDGKYGLIDFSGRKITKNIYDSIESLEYKEGCFIVSENEKYGVINLKGNTLVNIEYDIIEADGYYNENGKSYTAGFIVAKKKEEGYKYGYINYNGKVILKNEYNEIYRVKEIKDDNDIYFIASRNGRAGIYKNEHCILNHEYEEIEYNKSNNVFLVKKAAKYGVANINGKIIINPEYNSILFSKSTINATKQEVKEVFDSNGNKCEDGNYENTILTENENYIITINSDKKYGVKNKNGEVLIKNNYQYIDYAYNKYFIVINNGKYGILNDEGKAEVDFEYDVIQRIEKTNTIQAIKISENITCIFDSNIKISLSIKNANIYIEDDYIKVLSNDDRKYIDKNGKVLSNKDIFKENIIFASVKDGKWGFVDKDGKEKVEFKYDMVTEVNKYGYAGIKLNNLWGVIDKEGNIIVEPIYSIEEKEPEFINKYYRLNYGYGFEYYSDIIK